MYNEEIHHEGFLLSPGVGVVLTITGVRERPSAVGEGSQSRGSGPSPALEQSLQRYETQCRHWGPGVRE